VKSQTLMVQALTSENWSDFEAVMGPNGASRGCWCMHWRLSIAEWMDQKGDGNRRAMRRLAAKTPPPGLIGYLEGEPIAWCSLGPRAVFPRLERSPLLKAVEDEQACAITCLFVHRDHRHHGLLPALLEAACSDAAKRGYELVEGYPIEPLPGNRAGSDTAMTGIASAFRKAGFVEVACPREHRPVMRKQL
jgi:GNAT superfamily N-acetyltransferase